jgi:hypothetical protein
MSNDLKDALVVAFIVLCFGAFFYGAPILFSL